MVWHLLGSWCLLSWNVPTDCLGGDKLWTRNLRPNRKSLATSHLTLYAAISPEKLHHVWSQAGYTWAHALPGTCLSCQLTNRTLGFRTSEDQPRGQCKKERQNQVSSRKHFWAPKREPRGHRCYYQEVLQKPPLGEAWRLESWGNLWVSLRT